MRRAVGVILAAPEEGDAARADEPAMQNVVEVGLDLRLTGSFLEPRLRPAQLHGATPEHRRRDPVEQRRLMEVDEWIRVLPMPAGRVATIDERDVHVGVIDQGVREGHAHRARAHHEVVGLRRSHRHGGRLPVASTKSGNGCYDAPRIDGARTAASRGLSVPTAVTPRSSARSRGGLAASRKAATHRPWPENV